MTGRSFLKACKSPLMLLAVLILALLALFPWAGVCLLGLFLMLLAVFPHCIPTFLLDEITLVDLTVRAWLSSWWLSLNQEWWHEIIPGLYLGAIPLMNYSHLTKLKKRGIQAVYAILEDREATLETFFAQPIRDEDWVKEGIIYTRLSCPDMRPLSLQQLEQASEWIHLHKSAGKSIYVHCKGGRERSPMAVMAYLMRYHHFSLIEAKAQISHRPLVRFRLSQDRRMREFEQYLQKGSSYP